MAPCLQRSSNRQAAEIRHSCAVGLAREPASMLPFRQRLCPFERLFLRNVACQSAEFRQIGYRRLGGKRPAHPRPSRCDRHRNKPSNHPTPDRAPLPRAATYRRSANPNAARLIAQDAQPSLRRNHAPRPAAHRAPERSTPTPVRFRSARQSGECAITVKDPPAAAHTDR